MLGTLGLWLKFVTGHYMVDIYLTTHENIKDAFSTLVVVATLLLGVGIALFLSPTADMWLTAPKSRYALAITSGWVC